MTPRIYIFRGSSASGKTTLVPKFCSLLPLPVARLEHDMFRWDIHRIGRKHADVTSDECKFAFHNLALMYEEYVKRGEHTLVVDGLFTWDDAGSDQGNVRELLDIAKRHGAHAQSIVLAADKAILRERNATRGWGVGGDEFEKLYRNVYKTIDPSETVIDSTILTPEQTLDKLQSLI